MERDNILELVSSITEFNDISSQINDEDVDEAMAYVVKLISRPDIPPAQAPMLIVKLQSLSAKFGILAKYYQTFGKGEPEWAHKKNMFYTLNQEIDKVVQALKYYAR